MKFSLKSLFLSILLMGMFHLCVAQDKLPQKWQSDMILGFSYGGGMRYYSLNAEIKETGSYCIVNNHGKETHYKLVITKKHLEDLLAFLREKQFTQIKTEDTGPTDDKGTESISLRWEGNYLGAGESYATSIAQESKANYQAIRAYIQQLIEKTKKKSKKK